MLMGAIPAFSFQLNILAPSHLQVAITESHRVVFVHLALQLIVAGETVRLREEHDLLHGADLCGDVKDLEDVILWQWRVPLHAQHLQATTLLARTRDQHLAVHAEGTE